MKSCLFRKGLIIGLIALLIVSSYSTIASLVYRQQDTIAISDIKEKQGTDSDQFTYQDDLSNPIISGDGETRYWAVIIAVGFNPHQYIQGVRDAKELYRVLINHGWEENNIKVLIEEEATREAIIDTFRWLNDSGVDEDDVVLFSSGTHGYCLEDRPPLDEPDGLDEFIQPFDYDWETDDNCILDDELAMEFGRLKSKNIMVKIESCHSGGMIDGSADLCASGRVVLTSCAVDEISCPIFIRMHWLFPFYVTKGLKGFADKNRDKWVSAEEAFSYAKLPIMIRSTIFNLISLKTLSTQHPQIYDGWPTEENNEDELNIIDLSK